MLVQYYSWIIALCPQNPLGKKGKKAGGKTISPLHTTAEADKEADKEGDKEGDPVIIPHIVIDVTEKDPPTATELLRDSSLPTLDEVGLTFIFLLYVCIIIP